MIYTPTLAHILKMNYLNTIISTFKNHDISKYVDLKCQEFKKSKRHPSSEGIQFETSEFAGEIFFYNNPNREYCEMKFLVFKNEKSSFKIVEEISEKKLCKSIDIFLTEKLTELKNS